MDITFTQETDAHFSDSLLENIAQGNNTKVLSILQNASPTHLSDVCGSTLLHVAGRYNNVWFAQHLIDSGANVDAPNHSKETPLMVAIMHHQLETVEVLLNADADMFIADKSGQCALGKAFANRSRLGGIFPRNDNMWTICENIVMVLLDRVSSTSLSNSKHVENEMFHADCPLYYFMPLKNVEVTRILLDKGSSVNAEKSDSKVTSLHLAVENVDLENVRLLLEYGADVNKTSRGGKTPLAYFLDLSDQDKVIAIFEILIAAGAGLMDYDNGKIFVSYLLSEGNKEIIRSVLNCKFNLHFIDEDGYAALHYLAKNGNPDVLAELRGFDFEINIRTIEFEWTMLHFAVSYGNISSILFLLDCGADIDATCCYDYTPLNIIIVHHLLHSDRVEIFVKCIKMLLTRGANPQIVTEKNYWRQLHTFQEPSSDTLIKMMTPIIAHLPFLELSDQKMIHTMQTVVLSNPQFKNIFDSKKVELENMNRLMLGYSVTLLEFLVASDEQISLYARNRMITETSFRAIKKYSLESCYQLKLRENFFKWTKLIELRKKAAIFINEIFVELWSISVYSVAEKIIYNFDDYELNSFL